MVSTTRPNRRSGAVVLWVLVALAIGLLVGLGIGKGWGPFGRRPGGAPDGKRPQSASADIRVNGAGVEWLGKNIRFAELETSATKIKAAVGDKPVRVVFAKDVDHLDEEKVRTALRNAGLQVVESHE